MEVLGRPTGTGEIISCLLAILATLLLFVSYPMLVIWKLSSRIHTARKFYPYPVLSFYWSSISMYTYFESVYESTGFPATRLLFVCVVIYGYAGVFISALCIFLFCPLYGSSNQESITFWFFGTSIFIVNPAIAILTTLTLNVSYDRPVAVFFGILMYASPLPIIMDRCKDGVSDYHPSWLCSTLLLNSLAWTLVSFKVPNFDLSFTVTNVIGTILTLSQLVLIHGFFKLSMIVISGAMKFSRGVSSVLHCTGYFCLAAVIIFHSYILLIGPMMMSQA